MKPTILTAALLASFGSFAKADTEISSFAANVATHVLYHELAHALIREFDIPVIANEEVMADSFATVWLTQKERDTAPQIIRARVMSWVYEDGKIDPIDYDFEGEHQIDIRRAFQVACLMYGADPVEWGDQLAWLGVSDHDLADCSDTAPDQIKGWEKVLAPNILPDGEMSENVEVIFGEGPMKDEMRQSGVMRNFGNAIRVFDWPNPITVRFDHCDIGAQWSRTERSILLCDDYVQRFIDQGEALGE